jgi:hypothetical protein
MEDRTMRTVVLACALVMSLAPRGLAAPTAEEMRKIIAERCAKVDHISMECAVFYGRANSGSGGDEILYQFDRPTRRLQVTSLGLQSPVVLFIEDRHASFLLHSDEEGGSPTYLEIHRDRAIGWNDITAALQVMKKECEPYGMVCCPYELCSEISTCFVAPFLDGGMDVLFSKHIQPLSYDGKLLAADPERAMGQLAKTEKLSGAEVYAVTLGHPDSKLLQSPVETPPRLAPEKFPLCFKRKDESHSLVYAFNRESGVFLSVTGTVDHRQIFFCPGNEVSIYAKAGIVKEGYMPKSMLFKLPKDARIIGVADLKSEYRRMLSETSLDETVKQKATEEEELQKLIREESDLSAKLARLSADAKTDRKTLEEVRLQLALTRGDETMYVYRVAKLQKLIDARERLKKSQPSQKPGASAKKGE